MRKAPAVLLNFLFFTFLLAGNVVALPQSECGALNAARGEGKFTGQISNTPDGTSMEVTYGDQSVLVHYTASVTVCQGGQPASVNALARGASVSVFGPVRRNGKNMEIDAARIFVAGRPLAAQPAARPAQPSIPTEQTQPSFPRAQEQSHAPGLTPIPNSVILRGGTHEETMQRLRVVRTYALPELRNRSQVMLGAARLDFRPMLSNPKALFNIAQRLHAMPQHVEIKEEKSEVSEVEQGLVIHHLLTYRILPGKCSDAGAKAQLASAGVECFTRASTSERITEFSTKGSPRYVADPAKRQAAIAAYQRNSALGEADAAKGIADLRKALADPTQRAAIAAQVGQAEAERMSSLSDDQLKEEMLNTSVQRYEETMFVPKLESTNYLHAQHTLTANANAGEVAAGQKFLHEGAGGGSSEYPKLLKVVPTKHLGISQASGGDKSADLDLGPYIFLTGFTIGHDYEWKWGVHVTVNWCVVGCSSTYGIDLHAGFGYGFGLRFPIQAQFKYHSAVRSNNSVEASLTANFKPIEGTVDDFFSAGLSGDQLFDAKELVAQVGADAGYSVSLPGLGDSHDDYIGVDFTSMLPPPLTNGRFLPPTPGTPGTASPYIFDSVDLLMGLLNFGVVGAQLFPAVDIDLFSSKLQLTLNDEILNRQTSLTSSPQTVAVGVTPGAGGNESHFSVGNPVYNIGVSLTPGLNPRIFVDVAVWSDHWDWQIWFPQLAVDLPPHGQDFGCHAGTTCVLSFQPVFDAGTGQVKEVSKETAAADRTLTGGGCQRVNGQEGNYLCPVKGMLELCQAMLKNNAVSSCGPLVPNVVDEILKRGKCTDGGANYVCPSGMMGLCELYVKNQEILSCKQGK